MGNTLNVIENIKVKKVIFNCGEYNDLEKDLIKTLKMYDRAKDYSKDRHKGSVYFENVKLLNEAGKEYGKNIIK